MASQGLNKSAHAVFALHCQLKSDLSKLLFGPEAVNVLPEHPEDLAGQLVDGIGGHAVKLHYPDKGELKVNFLERRPLLQFPESAPFSSGTGWPCSSITPFRNAIIMFSCGICSLPATSRGSVGMAVQR